MNVQNNTTYFFDYSIKVNTFICFYNNTNNFLEN